MAKVPWGRETMAGLAGAIGSVPDGMATAVLAGAVTVDPDIDLLCFHGRHERFHVQ